MRRDLGDFQTPPGLVSAVLDRLDALGIPRRRVLEPACGRGHFLSGLLARPDPPAEVRGFEIQADHVRAARSIDPGGTSVTIEEADLFSVDLASRPAWESDGPLLVVGNPPWVTTADLGRLGSANRPARAKVDGVSGLDARTGRSNFDLAEAVWHKLLAELTDPGATIALLCKTSTARNVLRWSSRTGRPIASASMYRIDARRWFDAAVDACLFVVRLGRGAGCYRAEVYPDLASESPDSTIGVVDDLLVADLDAFEGVSAAFGRCTRVWRQGVKHDAAGVMELIAGEEGLREEPSRLPLSSRRLSPKPSPLEGEGRVGGGQGRGSAIVDRFRPAGLRDRASLTPHPTLPLGGGGEEIAIRAGIESHWRNGRGESVDVESEHIYPLLKGADLARPNDAPGRGVIVTQRRLGEDTNRHASTSPRLWSYLQSHADAFAARRSKVYDGRPPFAMFGVGDYTFAPHKVAVSGLHKAPRFRAIGPVGGRPVLLDDTCYFLPCGSAREARRLAARLNGPVSRSLLASLCFADAKRPVTKAILQRIDVDRLPGPRRSLACPRGVD